MNVWWLVIGATAWILLGVLWLRMHALLVLLIASLLVAVLTPKEAILRFAEDQQMSELDAKSLAGASGPKRLAVAFGQTAGEVGILIALASIVGICLLESGAASGIVNAMMKVGGTKRAPESLAFSAFVLGIPVFFDTVFYLMMPLARTLRQRTGRDYALYIMAIMAGGAIAHSLVPPTPGPLQVAEILHIETSTMIFAGLAVGGLTSVLSLLAARMLNRFTTVPLRDPACETDLATDDSPTAQNGNGVDVSPALTAAATPPLLWSLLPIVLPVALISYGAVDDMLPLSLPQVLRGPLELLADKNVAMGVSAALSLTLLKYAPSRKPGDAVANALASGGQVILITSAGGALGAMLRQAGIASAVSEIANDVSPSWLLVVAFLVTTAIRSLQGSATVAMITAAGVLQGFSEVKNLPFHPVYIAMAIGVGSKPICWMTDSGFWIMCKMSGMSDSEGLRTVTLLSIAMGISGLLVTVLLANLFPAT